jgi:hypothetical protein
MTIDSTFLLFAAVLGIGFILIGHGLKLRIFNLLSVAVFLFLSIELSDHVALLIAFIGVGLFEIYYTFFGGE